MFASVLLRFKGLLVGPAPDAPPEFDIYCAQRDFSLADPDADSSFDQAWDWFYDSLDNHEWFLAKPLLWLVWWRLRTSKVSYILRYPAIVRRRRHDCVPF